MATETKTLEEVKELIRKHAKEMDLPQRVIDELVEGIEADENGNVDFIEVMKITATIAECARNRAIIKRNLEEARRIRESRNV